MLNADRFPGKVQNHHRIIFDHPMHRHMMTGQMTAGTGRLKGSIEETIDIDLPAHFMIGLDVIGLINHGIDAIETAMLQGFILGISTLRMNPGLFQLYV